MLCPFLLGCCLSTLLGWAEYEAYKVGIVEYMCLCWHVYGMM
jgi:hypothetical protein